MKKIKQLRERYLYWRHYGDQRTPWIWLEKFSPIYQTICLVLSIIALVISLLVR